MTEMEVAEILQSFEREHGLYGLTLGQVSVWRLFRFPVGMALQNLPLFQSKNIVGWDLLRRFFVGLLQLLKLMLQKNSPRYIVKSYVSALRLQVDGKYRDIYFDDLLEAHSGGSKWQFPNVSGFEERERNACIPPQFDTVVINVVGAVLARLLPLKTDNGVFRKLADLICSELELEEFDERRIRRVYSAFVWQSRIYAVLLRRLRPKTVIVVDTGERALLWTCRQLGIRFIELQHGMFTQHHPDALPSSALNSANGDLLLPDILAVYGNYWKETLSRTALGVRSSVVPVGAAIIDRYRAYRLKAFTTNPSCPIITLSTQGLDRDNLISFLQDFLASCKSDFVLNIKLHPAYDSSLQAYAEGVGRDPRVYLFSGKENPNTYELISMSDLHLSITSACHYDALGIGVPTVVIGLAGYQLMSDLLSHGDAIIAMTPKKLAEIVSCGDWIAVPLAISNNYYKRNFVENIQPLID